jgi:fucose 4-O-acetylase-like acetyltransferase
MARKRLEYIDLLKGIAILLVVVGHFIQYNTYSAQSNFIYKTIYSFHMELFMFLSGYIAFKTTNIINLDDGLKFLKKKAVSLLLPYITWGIFYNVLHSPSYPLDFKNILVKIFIHPGDGTLWFLWFLFFLMFFYVCFVFLNKIFNKNDHWSISFAFITIIFVILLIIKSYSIISYIPQFTHHYIFFFSGIIFSSYNSLKIFLFKQSSIILSVLFFLIVSVFPLRFFPDKLVGIFLSFAAIHIVYYFVTISEWEIRIKSNLMLFGRNSLVIYATHYIFIDWGFKVSGNQASLLIIAMAGALPIIYLSIFMKSIAEKIPFFNLILYGMPRKAQ